MFLPDMVTGADGTTGTANIAPPLPLVLPPPAPLVLRTDASIAAQPKLRCATRDGTAAEARAAAAKVAKAAGTSGGVFVNVHWTVVHDGAAGNLSRSDIEAQVRHLNAAWGGVADAWSAPGWQVAWRPQMERPAGVFFTLTGVQYRDDAGFFASCSPTTGPAWSAAHNVDTAHTMNVYSCLPSDNLLGWTSFPSDMANETDGAAAAVFVRHDTLPGVSSDDAFGLGNTLVHEAGHYFGLYHVFQGATCSSDPAAGDGVADTTPQRSPTYGSCAANREKSSCPPAVDGVTNYMDYSDDACMRVFTPQQIQLIHETVREYRPSLYDNVSPCPRTRRRTRRVAAGEPCAAPPILLEAQCC